ncbi:hypothetical protein ACHQM5_010787 [Ranunculus cassubicifolius]
MGESTCLMQPFSNPSDTFNLPQEGNSLHVLGESVSFGRFMTESLAWEKWSSFNSNRYLEEVEKCSKPGSVAQKKAYFEAHYKKKRAEQEAAAAMKDESEIEACLYGAVQSECGNETELVGLDCRVDVDQLGKCERGVAEVSTSDISFSFDVKECDSNVETGDLDHIIAEVDSVKEIHVLEENYAPTESVSQHEDVENRMIDKPEIDITMPTEKLPLKETSSANCEPSAIKMKPSASSTKTSVNRAKVHPFTPARPKTPANLRKENNPALSSKKSVKDSADKRKPTPSPLHLSLNFTPSRVGDESKTARPIFSPRFTAGLTKTQKESSRPLPPAKESGNKTPKPRPVTPLPDTRIRTKVSVDHTVHVNRKIDVKYLSIDVSRKTKSSSVVEKRTWLPSPSASVSSSFSLRSEERAAKRKEYFQKLQEEHNAKEAQKMHLKAKSEEKAEAELRKMRQNLGFKAKPMPDFYHEPQPQKVQLKKIPLTRPRSPKLGRKSSSSGVHETKPLPPRTPSVKNDASNKKPSRTPTASKKSCAHENASPNIQK